MALDFNFNVFLSELASMARRWIRSRAPPATAANFTDIAIFDLKVSF